MTDLNGGSHIINDPKYCILVVDDDNASTLFCKMALEEEGFSVEAFTDPLEAIQCFKPNYYDLVLLDVRMPKMNGFELYNVLKVIDNSIKVCFITGFEPYFKSLNEQFNLEESCYIRKPVKKNELVEHVIDQLITSE